MNIYKTAELMQTPLSDWTIDQLQFMEANCIAICRNPKSNNQRKVMVRAVRLIVVEELEFRAELETSSAKLTAELALHEKGISLELN